MRIPILYQDSDLVVVNKPAGIPTHAADPADPYPGDALRIVRAQTGLPYLGMHQRLDADTSGVLLFAARREANRALAAAFEGREVRKVYLALVHGAPPRAEGVIDAAIVREHGERYRVASPGDPRGLPARTRYRVIGTVRNKDFGRSRDETTKVVTTNATLTLLEVAPETGRPHQIRIHLAHVGCPVVGDPLYGLRDQPAPRLCLHAYQLTLPHPATGEMVTYTAPPPELLRTGDSGGDRPQHVTNNTHSDETIMAHENRRGLGDEGISPAVPSPRPLIPAIFRADGHAARGATADENVPQAAGLPRGAGRAQSSGLRYRAMFRAGGGAYAHVRDAVHAPDALRALLQLAADRRSPLAADPDTTIYRLVNAAADGLPGLTVDRYGDALVASIYDDGDAGPPPPAPEPLIALLAETAGAGSVYVKYRPKQASRIPEEQLPALAPSQPALGPDLEEFVAREEGLDYLIRPGDGLSTGLFPDMREGRVRVRAWAEGRRVLNCFAYTCGFGVAAMAGAAQRVLNLDLSRPVLEWGQANYRANGFEPDPHDFVYGNVFDWLARLAKRGDRFGLVILDPPGFSKTKSRRFSAERDYGELATLAARVMAPDGLLLACCNVAELPWRGFRDRVLAGLAAAGRTAKVAGVYHEPAVDFPVPMGGEPYLKMVLLEVG